MQWPEDFVDKVICGDCGGAGVVFVTYRILGRVKFAGEYRMEEAWRLRVCQKCGGTGSA